MFWSQQYGICVKGPRLWNNFAVWWPLKVEGDMRVGGTEVRYSHLSRSPHTMLMFKWLKTYSWASVSWLESLDQWKCTNSSRMTQTSFAIATNIPKPWHNPSLSKDDCEAVLSSCGCPSIQVGMRQCALFSKTLWGVLGWRQIRDVGRFQGWKGHWQQISSEDETLGMILKVISNGVKAYDRYHFRENKLTVTEQF